MYYKREYSRKQIDTEKQQNNWGKKLVFFNFRGGIPATQRKSQPAAK